MSKHRHHASRPQKHPPGTSEGSTTESQPRGERLQKVLAAAGIASRRECEQIVLEGRVEVDGEVVTRLGTRVDPQRQEIRVDGTALPRTRLQYYVINKPQGVVTTSRDPWARTRVIDLAPEKAGRLFAVGRLRLAGGRPGAA
jgi:23S rRNA pseudouridine2605 synthase